MAKHATTLEDMLLVKSRPKWNSKRYNALMNAVDKRFCHCEFCGKALLNPQSILIHQGGFCQNKPTQ